MQGLKKKRRIQIIILSLMCLTGASTLIGFSLREGINFFMSPSEVIMDPPDASQVFRVGGLVVKNTIRPPTGVPFSFDITDGGHTLTVRYTGTDLRPDLFEEGQGTIAKGTLVNGIFFATEILAKHDEKYMPKEIIDALKEQGVYQEPSN